MALIKPYKILSLIFVLVFILYARWEYNFYLREKEKTTNDILKEFVVRKKGFDEKVVVNGIKYDEKKDDKIEILVSDGENKNTEKDENVNNASEQVKIFEKKYIQAATFQTEKSAREEAKRLGEGYKVKEVLSKGKRVYQVVTDVINDEETFIKLENRAKNLKMKYVVRMVGK